MIITDNLRLGFLDMDKILTPYRVVNPGHPIASGMKDCFVIPHEEMYGEHFDIPAPDETVFISWFQGGEVFRSGCCFYRGNGKIFIFRLGH